MPKAKKPAPFAIFVEEFRQRSRLQGVIYTSFEDASTYASELWNEMDAFEREQYKQMAKDQRFGRNGPQERLASNGVPVAFIEKRLEDEKKEKNDVISRIKEMITVPGVDKMDIEFYILHLNYYLLTKNYCYPAELAVCKFSLKNGLEDYLHMLINPGELPVGTPGEVKDHSEKTHGIPYDFEGGINDYNHCIQSIINFAQIKPGNEAIFFTAPDNVLCNYNYTAADYFLKQELAGYGNIKLYPLNELYVRLNVDPLNVIPSASMAEQYLQSIEPSARGISCRFHYDKGNVEKCSLSIATSWIFSMCESCLPATFKRIYGKHIPPKMDERVAKELPPPRSDYRNSGPVAGPSSHFGDSEFPNLQTSSNARGQHRRTRRPRN